MEIEEFNYADAMVNCKNQFGFENTGKLFEPRDSSTNTQVLESAYLISPSSFHIGINDRDSEGTPILQSTYIHLIYKATLSFALRIQIVSGVGYFN